MAVLSQQITVLYAASSLSNLKEVMKPKHKIIPAPVHAENPTCFLQANASGALFSIYLHMSSQLIILSYKHLSDMSKE